MPAGRALSIVFILGISALAHDPAAALVSEPGILAAIEESKLERARNVSGIPRSAIRFCLERAGIASILTARHRYGFAQDCVSRHQSFDLIHEDRWTVWIVQIFLKKNVGIDDCLRENNVKPARSASPRG